LLVVVQNIHDVSFFQLIALTIVKVRLEGHANLVNLKRKYCDGVLNKRNKLLPSSIFSIQSIAAVSGFPAILVEVSKQITVSMPVDFISEHSLDVKESFSLGN
jgi:hypothetical protein